jgi:hypothetical protein
VTEPESPADRRWLDALRAGPPAPAEARARVLARLEAVIPEMKRGPGGGNGGGGGGPNGASHGPSALGARAIAVTAFLIGGVSGAALFATLGPGPGTRIVTILQPAPASPEATSPVANAVPAQATTEIPSSAPAPVRSAPPVSPARSHAESDRAAPPVRTSQLAAERMLLDEARAGLVQGEPERALDRLELHRKRYPSGMLDEERDAMAVEALVGMKRYEAARSAAQAFRVRTPRSMFLPTVESAIASIP